MKIIATNIGERKEVDWKGKTVVTGIFKYPVTEPIYLDTEEVKNDAICNSKYHGGVDQAVYAYSLDHYAYWQEAYPDLEWSHGMFGENLTVEGLDEAELHVGNQYRVGETVLEVTKPREPCMKLGVRFNNMRIVKHFWKENFPGVYFKVLQTGQVKAGDVFECLKSCPENETIVDVYARKRNKK